MARPNPTLPELSGQDVRRFWSKVKKGALDECWPWQGAPDEDGYGLFKVRGKMCRATRIAYFLHYGEQPGDKLVCHTCDYPPCTNPAHFFLGTVRDNAQDCVAKGRKKTPTGDDHWTNAARHKVKRGDEHWARAKNELAARGERNGAAILTAPDVLNIRTRQAAGESMRALARAYRVNVVTVHKIVHHITWKHIN